MPQSYGNIRVSVSESVHIGFFYREAYVHDNSNSYVEASLNLRQAGGIAERFCHASSCCSPQICQSFTAKSCMSCTVFYKDRTLFNSLYTVTPLSRKVCHHLQSEIGKSMEK
jgi:hypothetical protein